MNGKYYKASDKFSVTGLALMTVCTALVGMAISWVYLKLNAVCPVVYLCILMAALYGAGMGGIAYIFIKKFKLRSPKFVIISLSVALLFTTYFKWALYDHFDRQDQYEYVDKELTDTINELNGEMKDAGIDLDLNKPVLTVVDDFYSEFIKSLYASFGGEGQVPDTPKISEQLKSKESIERLQKLRDEYSKKPGTDYKKTLGSSGSGEGDEGGSSLLSGDSSMGLMTSSLSSGYGDTYAEWCDYYLERHPDASLWETMGLSALFGDSDKEIEESIDKLGKLSIREYVLDYHGDKALEYLGYKSSMSTGKLMTHPGTLISDIKDINSEGRWSYSSSHSVSNEDRTPVHGFMLWLVWLGELIVINAPAFAVAIPMCQRPFIESDNDWAEKFPTQFKFTAINAQALKSSMESDPLSLFNNQALVTAGGRTNYFTVTLYHSRSYMENYVSVDNTTYDQRRKTYNHKTFVNYLTVDTEFVGTLFTVFGLAVPVGCHPSPLYAPGGFTSYVPEGGQSVGEMNKGVPQQTAPQQQAAAPQYQQPQQQAAPQVQSSLLAAGLQQQQNQQQPQQKSGLLGGSLLGGSLLGGGQPAPTIAPQPQTFNADSIFGEQEIIRKPPEESNGGGTTLLKPKEEDRPLVPDASGTSGFMDGLDTSHLNLDEIDFK